MKGKKVLKVFLVTMVVVTMLAQVAAFATDDGLYYTTNTEYDMSTKKAKVTSTVYGIGEGEEITFLVENSTNILYIDQINESDYNGGTESASFTYLVNAADANGTASVKFASTSNAASAINPKDVGTATTGDDTVVLDEYTVTYTKVGEGAVFVDASNDEAQYEESTSPASAYNEQQLTFYVAPAPGYEFSGYTYKVGDITGDGNVTAGDDSFTYTVTADAEITINFTEITTEYAISETEITDAAAPTTTGYKGKADATITMYATIDNNPYITEYGILVTKAENVLDSVSSLDNLPDSVKKCQALGSYANKFGVKLVDTDGTNFDNTVYIRTYVKATDGTSTYYDFGEVRTVTLPE